MIRPRRSMPKRNGAVAPSVDRTIVIAAPPERVLQAFFDPDALGAWWNVTHAVTTPRVFGSYAIEWPPTDFRDDILGRLGGVFRGTVTHFQRGHEFFVAEAFWLPPDGDPVGPMALEVTCTAVASGGAPATRLHVMQSGYDESVRWRRYYEVIGHGWERALVSLKALLEH